MSATTTQQQLALAEHYFRSGQTDIAESLLRHLIGGEGRSIPKAYELLAYLHGNRGQLQACEALLHQASRLPGVSAETIFYLGRVRLQQGHHREAIVALEAAIQHAGEFFEAHHELGVAYSAINEPAKALACFLKAAELKPQVAELQFNIGCTFDALSRFDEALRHYDRALQLQPRSAHAWSNRGATLTELGRPAEALESYRRALAIAPLDVPCLINQATTLQAMKRPAEALACYEEAMRLAPDTDYLRGSWLHAKMLACDWDGLEEAWRELETRVERGEKASPPFALFSTPASRAALLACARTYVDDKYPARPLPAPTPGAHTRSGKIRVGYFCADFHNHATSQLMARLFECHDRDRFEWFGYTFGRSAPDAMRARIASGLDHFIDVSSRGDLEIAELARAAGLDIAVDLNGFTQHARPGIFSHRAAPIQVNYLAFPGSMGCTYIDYIVADETLIRADEHGHYQEQVVTLPDCYQANDDTKVVGGLAPSRASLGLPAQGFVFACFNNSYKINPPVFDVWMRLLHRVPGSVLWLLKSSDAARTRLLHEAEARGVTADRIVWADRVDLPAHLARHACADLFLDTFDYNAHTTGSDALWAGLPVLTLEGATFSSRVAASQLKAIGLPELVTQNVSDYEAAAGMLATSPARLAGLRERLARHRATAPLFDTARFARHLESAFHAMWDRHRRGVVPGPIRIAAGDTP